MGRNTPGKVTRRTAPPSPGSDPAKRWDHVDPEALRTVFDRVPAGTVGLEEEVMLLDADGLPLPIGPEVVQATDDRRVKVELPAAQVELATDPHPSVTGAVAELAELRSLLDVACGDAVRPAAMAVHPCAPAEGALTPGDHYAALAARHGPAVRRQLLGALQVHVAVGGADRTLAVYNALRAHLPALAALASAAPFRAGCDTGLASVRPLVAGLLPRQGVPPALLSWEDFAADLAWGARSGAVESPSMWWWELRPHLVHGTLELRVPDVQPTLAHAGAVAALAHALVRCLSAQVDAGVPTSHPATWRIAENRWAALRGGVEGHLADLDTGECRPARRVLHDLIDEVEPWATGGLDHARHLVERNAAMDLRGVGIPRALAWLVESFSPAAT